ncbi:MAG: hypothetical protein ABI586_10535 [Candidatus Nanopelagicales bacterium]
MSRKTYTYNVTRDGTFSEPKMLNAIEIHGARPDHSGPAVP